jgi:glycosyltransferase involved in cell wall biosynthesis
MDLVAEMLVNYLQEGHSDSFAVTRICPAMRLRLTRQKSEVRGQKSEIRARLFNADRFLNRFWDYPRVARRLGNEFDLFHLVDHSYSQLLHELPPERTIVTCHDLDTFQCLLNPDQEPRSVFFKAMMKRTLSGFRKAGFVACDSVATRDELLAHDLVRPERTAVVPNGVHPSCSSDANPTADAEAGRIIEVRGQRSEVRDRGEAIDILHVGSTIPRKRIDVLLRVFAEVKKRFPQARLLRVGGHFTAEQAELAEKMSLRESILVLPYLERDVLAAVYRRSALVLQPSEREGFGLPLVEAMACGTPVVASDLPVLREAGGEAATYCPVAELDSWSQAICGLITERNERPEMWAERQRCSIAQAARFSWAEYAGSMAGIYQEVLKSSRSEVYSRTSDRKVRVNPMAVRSIEGSVRPE